MSHINDESDLAPRTFRKRKFLVVLHQTANNGSLRRLTQRSETTFPCRGRSKVQTCMRQAALADNGLELELGSSLRR